MAATRQVMARLKKNGKLVGTARTRDVTKDQVLGMIILGKCPSGAIPGPGALTG